MKKDKKTGAAKFKVRCSRYLYAPPSPPLPPSYAYTHAFSPRSSIPSRPHAARCHRHHALIVTLVHNRYTLVVDDKDKAAKFERDLPKALSPSELSAAAARSPVVFTVFVFCALSPPSSNRLQR